MLMRPRLRLLLALLLAAALPFAVHAQDRDFDDLEAGDDQRRRTREPVSADEITQADLAQAVLVVPFAGETSESTGIGVLLEGFLRDQLGAASHLEVFGLDEVPDVEGVESSLYYEGCPPGNELGCQFVIGESARVERVLGGRVTVREDGRYRVVVTILNIELADVEFTYAVDLGPGEEEVLPATAQLALDRLKREELLAPMRDARQREAATEAALAEAQTEEERAIVARMDADLDIEELEALQLERLLRREKVTEDDLAEIKSVEGTVREWEEMGLTERQYLSYRNSGLDWDKWKWRWAGHRLMITGSVHAGFVGGSIGLRYYGKYLLTPDLGGIADTYAWQHVETGTSVSFGANIGFGILRNLDIDVGFFWANSPVWIKLETGRTEQADDGSGLVPAPDNRPQEWLLQTNSTWGGEVMVRFFVLTMPVIRPTVAGGFSWMTYPNLYATEDAEQGQGIPDSFPRFTRLTDFGVQLEPGVQFDFNRFIGVFLRVPVFIGLNQTGRSQVSGTLPRPVIRDVDEVAGVPFGTVRVVAGVQGRILGLPVKKREKAYYEEIDEDEGYDDYEDVDEEVDR